MNSAPPGSVHVGAAGAATLVVIVLAGLPAPYLALSIAAGLACGAWAGSRTARAMEERVNRSDGVVFYLEDTAAHAVLRLLSPFAFALATVAISRSARLQVLLQIVLCLLSSGWLAHEAFVALRVRRIAARLGPRRIRWLYARSAVGPEGMIGRIGIVSAACEPAGLVKIAGELWRAESHDGTWLAVGQPVRVRWLDGLVLIVESDGQSPAGAASA